MKRRASVDRTDHTGLELSKAKQCWNLGWALKGLSTDADNEFPDNIYYECVFLEFEWVFISLLVLDIEQTVMRLRLILRAKTVDWVCRCLSVKGRSFLTDINH